MGFIKVETVLDGDKRFAFEIESAGIYKVSCLSRTPIETLDKIYQICIVRDMVIIRTEDRDFRNGRLFASWQKDNRMENNILAYDWQGTKLWNIGEIVGDIKEAFLGFYAISHKQVAEEFGIELPDDAGQLLRCHASCCAFIIDASNQSLIHKYSGKF